MRLIVRGIAVILFMALAFHDVWGQPGLPGSLSYPMPGIFNGGITIPGGKSATINGTWAGSGAPGALNTSNVWTARQSFKDDPPTVDLAAYGAVGDGVTDDTAAITAWINAFNALPRGGIAFAGPGNYSVSCASLPTWKNPGVITGAGAVVTRFSNRTGDTGSCMVIGPMVFNPGYVSLTVRQLSLYGNGATDASGLVGPTPTGNPNFYVQEVEIEHFQGVCLNLNATTVNTIRVSNTVVANCGSWGVDANTNNLVFDGVTAVGNGTGGTAGNVRLQGYAIVWKGGGTSSTTGPEMIIGSSAATRHVVVIGTYIQGSVSSTAGIQTANATDITLIGNHITCGGSTQFNAIRIGGNTSNVNVHGGEADNCGAGSYGVLIDANAGGTTPDTALNFTGYRFTGGGATPILNNSTLAYTLGRWQESGSVALVAGAATVTLPMAYTNSAQVTCTDTTAANPVRCSSTATTITVAGTATDTINWITVGF